MISVFVITFPIKETHDSLESPIVKDLSYVNFTPFFGNMTNDPFKRLHVKVKSRTPTKSSQNRHA